MIQGKRFTAIIIDDESWTRDVLRYVGKWNEFGIEIIAEASDGEYGLKLALNLKPDIIVTDVRMPNMDGLQLAEELRKRNYKTEILYVSGYDEFEYVRNAMRLQALDYLLKPIKEEELNMQLERCIKKLERRDEGVQELDFYSIYNKVWMSEYMAVKENIYESMKIHNRLNLEKYFAKLRSFIREKEGNALTKDLTIYIYYDLYNLIYNYITEHGYTYGDIFKEYENSCVFNEELQFDDMIMAMENVAGIALENIEQIAKEKQKLDLNAVRLYVNCNYTKGITLEETADHFFVTKEYLSKVFKEKTGMSFSSYLTELRMGRAKELLLMERIAIKDIVDMIGYKELGSFYRAFKKYYGVAPGEMLQKIKDIQNDIKKIQ